MKTMRSLMTSSLILAAAMSPGILPAAPVDEADDPGIETVTLTTNPYLITDNLLTDATPSSQQIGMTGGGLESPPANMKDVWIKLDMPSGRHHVQVDFFWNDKIADGFMMLYSETPGGSLGSILAMRRPHIEENGLRTGIASCCYVSNAGDTIYARFGSTNNTASGQFLRVQCVDTNENTGAADLPNDTLLIGDMARLSTHSSEVPGSNPDIWYQVTVAPNSVYRAEMFNTGSVNGLSLYRNTLPLQLVDEAVVNAQNCINVCTETGDSAETFLLRVEFTNPGTGANQWLYSRYIRRIRNDEPRVDTGHPFRLGPGQSVNNVKFHRALPSNDRWPGNLGYVTAPQFLSYHNLNVLTSNLPNPSAWYYVDLYKNSSLKASFSWPGGVPSANGTPGHAMALYVDTATESNSGTPPNPTIVPVKGYARQTTTRAVTLSYKYSSKLASDPAFQRVWIRLMPGDSSVYDYASATPAGLNRLTVTHKAPPAGISPPQ